MTREREGLLLCLVSAAGFGAMAIFAKEAYATGLDVTTLLALRFLIAAAMLWALIALRRRPLGSPRGLMAGGVLGLWYAAQAGLFFTALERIDAGLASLLLYAYPALVAVGAFALGRERPNRRRVGALLLASAGVVLVLAGGGTGAPDAARAALCPGAPRPPRRGRRGARPRRRRRLHGLHPRLGPDGGHDPARAVRRQRRHRGRVRLRRRRARSRRRPRLGRGADVDRDPRVRLDGDADRSLHGRTGARRPLDG